MGWLLVLLVTLMIPITIEGQTTYPTGQGSPFVGSHRLNSKVFNNTRDIRVLLPPGYFDPANARTKYPVFYHTEGLMVFRQFDIEATVHGMINARVIPPIIIVGINNGGATDKTKYADIDRANEFLPYPDVGFAPEMVYKPEVPDPSGRHYPKFLAEVMAMIKKKYRVKNGSENAGIGGSSYGGVAALYAAMKMPGVFGNLMLESTPLWIGPDRQILKEAASVTNWPQAVWLAVGVNEASSEVVNAEGKKDHGLLIGLINKSSPRSRVNFFLDPDGRHQASTWKRRLPAALEFFFGSRRR